MQASSPSPVSRRNSILDALYSSLEPRQQLWVILDGARDDKIFSAVDMFSTEKCCLYAGELAPEIKVVAPYLVQLDREDRWTRYVIDRGWGESWGIFLRTDVSVDRLRKHLRRFLVAVNEYGRRMIFRYYDPRVMRAYLPTCLTSELAFVFGPIEEYLMESEYGSEVLGFSFDGVNLMSRSVSIGKAVE